MILSPPPPPPQPQMLKTDPNFKSSQVLISLVYKNEIFNTQYPWKSEPSYLHLAHAMAPDTEIIYQWMEGQKICRGPEIKFNMRMH